MGRVSLLLADCLYKGKTTIQCMYIPDFVKDPVDKPFRRCESEGLLDLKM